MRLISPIQVLYKWEPSKSYKVGWVVKEEKEEKLQFNSPANQKLTINN